MPSASKRCRINIINDHGDTRRMNRVILLLTVLTVLVVVPAMGDAYVDAKYWVRDTDDNLI